MEEQNVSKELEFMSGFLEKYGSKIPEGSFESPFENTNPFSKYYKRNGRIFVRDVKELGSIAELVKGASLPTDDTGKGIDVDAALKMASGNAGYVPGSNQSKQLDDLVGTAKGEELSKEITDPLSVLFSNNEKAMSYFLGEAEKKYTALFMRTLAAENAKLFLELGYSAGKTNDNKIKEIDENNAKEARDKFFAYWNALICEKSAPIRKGAVDMTVSANSLDEKKSGLNPKSKTYQKEKDAFDAEFKPGFLESKESLYKSLDGLKTAARKYYCHIGQIASGVQAVIDSYIQIQINTLDQLLRKCRMSGAKQIRSDSLDLTEKMRKSESTTDSRNYLLKQVELTSDQLMSLVRRYNLLSKRVKGHQTSLANDNKSKTSEITVHRTLEQVKTITPLGKDKTGRTVTGRSGPSHYLAFDLTADEKKIDESREQFSEWWEKNVNNGLVLVRYANENPGKKMTDNDRNKALEALKKELEDPMQAITYLLANDELLQKVKKSVLGEKLGQQRRVLEDLADASANVTTAVNLMENALEPEDSVVDEQAITVINQSIDWEKLMTEFNMVCEGVFGQALTQRETYKMEQQKLANSKDKKD